MNRQQNVAVKPTHLQLPSYEGILEGKMKIFPNPHQDAIIKAIVDVHDGKKEFSSVTFADIQRTLKSTSMARYMPKDIHLDLKVMQQRGMLEISYNEEEASSRAVKSVALSNEAKQVLFDRFKKQ